MYEMCFLTLDVVRVDVQSTSRGDIYSVDTREIVEMHNAWERWGVPSPITTSILVS